MLAPPVTRNFPPLIFIFVVSSIPCLRRLTQIAAFGCFFPLHMLVYTVIRKGKPDPAISIRLPGGCHFRIRYRRQRHAPDLARLGLLAGGWRAGRACLSGDSQCDPGRPARTW